MKEYLLNQCSKVTTFAVIMKDGKLISYSTNFVLNPQKECPRKDVLTGERYDICKEVCEQVGHAEENACKLAGNDAKGATLYLIGHNYVCDNCHKICREFGIKDIHICNTGEVLILNI